MENEKFIPTRALSEGCVVQCDDSGNCYCPVDESGNPNVAEGGGEGKHLINTTPDNPDDAPPIDVNADARYWPPDYPSYDPDTGMPISPPTNSDGYNRSVEYKGYQGNDPRALRVDPSTGALYPAKNQDAYGNPKYGTTGGWNQDFGGGGRSGEGFTDFCCTGAA